jgi:hypothetical protein
MVIYLVQTLGNSGGGGAGWREVVINWGVALPSDHLPLFLIEMKCSLMAWGLALASPREQPGSTYKNPAPTGGAGSRSDSMDVSRQMMAGLSLHLTWFIS